MSEQNSAPEQEINIPDTNGVELNLPDNNFEIAPPEPKITEIKVEDSIYSLPPVENPRYALIRLATVAEQIASPLEPKLLYDKPVLVNFAHHVLEGTEGIIKFMLADAFLAIFAQAVVTLRGKV